MTDSSRGLISPSIAFEAGEISDRWIENGHRSSLTDDTEDQGDDRCHDIIAMISSQSGHCWRRDSIAQHGQDQFDYCPQATRQCQMIFVGRTLTDGDAHDGYRCRIDIDGRLLVGVVAHVAEVVHIFDDRSNSFEDHLEAGGTHDDTQYDDDDRLEPCSA